MKWRVEHCHRRRCYFTRMIHFKTCPLPILPWTNIRIYLLRNKRFKPLTKLPNANSMTSSIHPPKTSSHWDLHWNRRKSSNRILILSDQSVEQRFVRAYFPFRIEQDDQNRPSSLAFSLIKWLPSAFGFVSKRKWQRSIVVRLRPTTEQRFYRSQSIQRTIAFTSNTATTVFTGTAKSPSSPTVVVYVHVSS